MGHLLAPDVLDEAMVEVVWEEWEAGLAVVLAVQLELSQGMLWLHIQFQSSCNNIPAAQKTTSDSNWQHPPCNRRAML